jgi:ketosteroid isomerase-like protein
LGRGDTRAAAALLADDALIFEEGSVERSKAEYVSHHLPADAAFSRVVSSTVTRRAGRSNGAVAWIATEGRIAGTYKGKAVDRMTTETMMLRRVGGAWRVVHIHWSSAARPQER